LRVDRILLLAVDRQASKSTWLAAEKSRFPLSVDRVAAIPKASRSGLLGLCGQQGANEVVNNQEHTRGVRLGTILGFPIFADATLLIIVGFLALYELRGGLAAFGHGLVFFGVIVGTIVWHEVGHAIAVRRLKLGESVIVLSGLGGRTLYRNSPTPKAGIVVALAGPFAGLALAGVLWGLAQVIDASVLPPLAVYAWGLIITVNLVINVANLAPIYPLDGGQVMRYAMQMNLGVRKGLQVTVIVGVVVLCVGAGLLYAFSGFQELFVWLIIGFVAAENWQLWRTA